MCHLYDIWPSDLRHYNQFIFDCMEKAIPFNEFFSQQCKPVINSSVLPNITFLTDKRIDQITIGNDEINSEHKPE